MFCPNDVTIDRGCNRVNSMSYLRQKGDFHGRPAANRINELCVAAVELPDVVCHNRSPRELIRQRRRRWILAPHSPLRR